MFRVMNRRHGRVRVRNQAGCQASRLRRELVRERRSCSLATTIVLAATVLLVGTAMLPALASGGRQVVLLHEDFEAGLPSRWVERGFPSIERKNRFSIGVEPSGNHYLEVRSDRSTSGKGVRLKFDPRRCPVVSWRWKISRVIASADLYRKDGDDSAAKLYILFGGPSRWNPFDKRLIVYVWDNRLPPGTILPNAWEPEKARMVVLESGTARAGAWVPERVDLARDYRRAFGGEELRPVEALAFMADTDNTGEQVTAGFDDLEVRCTGGVVDR
ncbi:MAG: DUF3047 domain-containing protein [Candidatus Dadabacteria bacterium]|nr:MAG: DUF3047 domain-containing protein [Candidatus Dadabacteria bacterium]